MTNAAIIQDLAERRVVERICDGVTRRGGRPETRDLSQHVYEILLKKTRPLSEIDDLEAFIYKIAYQEWTGTGAQFFRKYRGYGLRAEEFDENGAGGTVP